MDEPADDATDDAFDDELAEARRLLDGDDVRACYVGVVRGDEVDTTFAQRADDPREEGLQALSLLAAHLRLVADEADVEPSTAAADAATLASEVEEIPASADAVEEVDDTGDAGDGDLDPDPDPDGARGNGTE